MNRCRPWGVLGVAICLIAALSTPAVAAEDSKEDRAARAQEAFDKGVALYEKGEYAPAIVEFKKGYQLVENPIFLYNAGMAQMQLDKFDRARETAAKVAEMSSAKPSVRAKAAGLERGSSAVLAGRRVAGEAESDRRQRAESAADATREETGGRFGTLGWIGASAGAVGVGGLVGAAVVSAGLSDDWNELRRLRDEPRRREAFESKQSEIESKQTVGKVLLFSGASLAAAGAGLVVADLVSGGAGVESRGARASAAITPTGRLQLQVSW
ncbi:MAG: tetratricopeptide repeat protein [Bradymonadaceae bacterium]